MSGDWASLKSTFKYEQLNLDRPAFRLLRLKSARDSQATIECEIIQAYFDVKDVPDYEAISYTWGAITSPRKIRLDGSDFFVRFNLWSVLRDVRRQDEDRILWVDAVCINQDDVRERGHQVQQIRHVYERAERVVFWLGQLTNPSIDILMDLLAELQRRTRGVSWPLTDSRWRSQWEQIPKGSLDNLRSAFQEILERPWFRRVWILQEVANARAGLVHCGHKSLSAKIFAVCPRLLEVKPNQHCQAVLDVMPGPSRSGSWWEQDRRLHTLLRKFSETEATRDHDRIFALFGLCPEANAQITVDYTKPMPQLLRETVSYILKDNRCPYDIDSLPCFDYDSTETLLKEIDILHSRILEHLLEHESDDVVEDFLLQFQDQLAITPDLCITAMTKEELGNTLISSILHRNPQSPQVEDHQGRTPLQVATESGNEVLMRVLVKNGVGFKDLRGFLPLRKASELGNETIVRLLLDRGASCEITAADLNHPALALAGAKTRRDVEKQLSNNRKISSLDWSLDAALSLGHESIARLLFDHGAKAHETALGKALQDGNIPITRLLLDQGTLATGDQLLMVCEGGSTELERLLLDRDASIAQQALEKACEKGSIKLARLLLDRGTSITQHALEKACEKGSIKLARLLLDRGASITQHALEKACDKKSPEPAWLLLDRGSPITRRALEGAHKRDAAGLVQLLLDRGAFITRNALMIACKKENVDTVRLLVNKSAPITEEKFKRGYQEQKDIARLLFHGSTSMMEIFLEGTSYKGQEAFVRFFLDLGAAFSRYALLVACEEGHHDILRLFLDLDALSLQPALRDSAGRLHDETLRELRSLNSLGALFTPVCWTGCEAVARLLLDLGAPATASALRAASEKGHNAIVRLLVSHPLELDASLNYMTALSSASRYGHVDVAQTLLEAGANVNRCGKDGMTPLGWALQNRHESVVQLLRSRGAIE